MSQAPSRRLYFLDALRIALTVLLIAHHAGQAYGPTGGDWPVMQAWRAQVLGAFFTVNRSFFMSLFFLISGYLMVPSFDRHGARAFVGSRLLRYGVPVVAFALIVMPLRALLFNDPRWWTIDVGWMWYVEHLLLLSLIYAGWRWLRRKTPPSSAPLPLPRDWVIALVALGVAVLTALVRSVSPIDHWRYELGFFRVAWADVPRDVSAFIYGALAYRGDWLLRLPKARGYRWLAIGLALAALWYLYSQWLWSAAPGMIAVMDALYGVWEAFLCVGLCLGLLTLFRELVTAQGPLGAALARAQYAAYFIHGFVVIGVQLAAVGWGAPPLAKWAVVTAISAVLTFALADRLRRAPGVRAVL